MVRGVILLSKHYNKSSNEKIDNYSDLRYIQYTFGIHEFRFRFGDPIIIQLYIDMIFYWRGKICSPPPLFIGGIE